MQKNVVFILMFILMLSACSNENENQPGEIKYASVSQDDNQVDESISVSTQQTGSRDNKAQIKKIDTDLEKEHVWHFVPEGVSTMTISVEVENADTVLFWISETGTGTWEERTLIGYDIDGSDGWSITWEFGDRIFLDYITIQALGSDGVTQAQESFNLRSRDAGE